MWLCLMRNNYKMKWCTYCGYDKERIDENGEDDPKKGL
ncbi:hypothetical protein SPACI_016150 [Sporomusa acidovorans DSM 3132]|uniref:Uncharacterized protein n=1 Tax=Sporomusa acidovorans (strain ATCC 49682 / DSM 3132 / Mol) TaxID=1123286 RepID=A0ABZ3J0J1_SPOA4|nr:hypothetical protein SPACI_56750 [Sporomusa acidovorans DSM 3132]SDF53145.1 hypothetical protein SAMN04488499_10569 [Sporomusa acidovorans]